MTLVGRAIETERLVLRRFTKADARPALRLLADEEVMRFIPAWPARDESEALAYLEKSYLSWYRRADAGEAGALGTPLDLRFAICWKGGADGGGSSEPVGFVQISAESEAFELGYALARDAWHQGVASEAVAALVGAARAAGFPYLTATHDENNPRSGAVMARCGLTYRYTYRERWMPKDYDVSFRLWQIDLAPGVETYRAYWDEHPEHWVDVSGIPERAR